ncbi:MAG: hypothetical protein QMC83_00775 [Thermodesulfovibrionales bacterium]|nr:hypothetical protein [Thermodesulfovibrionales bacterium]
MYKPPIRYLVSSPYGDIPADKNKWHLPLEGDTLKTPYKIYFQSIKDFIVQGKFKPLLGAASKKLGREIRLAEVNEVIVRSEKHGFLYHPASIEVILKQGRVNPVRKGRALNEAGLSNGVKFGLNVAISEVGKGWLREEFSVLMRLNTKFNLPYLPEPYFFGELNAMSFLLEDWFEGYHEFHISRDKDGAQRLKLWDFDHGYKYLSSEQSFELYKQASKILTLYYDLKDFSQILHWHHAAGDFVVKLESTKIDVRLTTARRYEPLMILREKDPVNPFLGLFSFFLNLTIRMRLDKLNGMGEVVWADDICLEAAVKGFLEALNLKEELKHYIGSAEDFLRLLKSFGEEELKITLNPITDLYTKEEDFSVLIENLDNHVKKLYAILQILPL